MKQIVAALAGLLMAGPVAAQQSTSYKLEEHVLNAGGHPEAGMMLTSASYRMTLDALGDAVVNTGLASASYHLDTGFGAAYPPPGEVTGLRVLADRATLVWDPEKSVGLYNLYRGPISPGADCGLQYGVVDETTTDLDVPSAGQGFNYLVTAENRLGEEGSKGFQSNEIDERPDTGPCP